jgi:aminobenzoyl-glutamate transport protein
LAIAPAAVTPARTWRDRFLDGVERFGNRLPDPVAIFVIVIVLLIVLSVVGAAQGWSAINPVSGEVLVAKNLLSEPLVRQLLTEMPKTYTSFAPLGLLLVIILGVGVAERSGLFSAIVHRAMRGVPAPLLTPAVLLLGMLASHANDAGFLVLCPLAGVIFANAGRNPVMGAVLAFVGAATGLAGNLFPGQYDMLIFGITQTGAHLLDPQWQMNPLGNWWFQIAIAAANVSLGWLVTVRLVEPRLPRPPSDGGIAPALEPNLSRDELRGLRAAGLVAVAVMTAVAALMLWPGYSPLYDAEEGAGQRLVPFFRSIPGLLLMLFLGCGWAYGKAAGTISSHRDVIAMMAKGFESLLPYLVLIFFASHFVAMFSWSNLGSITAINGAAVLRSLDAPPALLLPLLATASAWLDFLIASGSAKWTAMAPVAVPMLMLLDVSPEMTTAAYRVGDTVTNLISPLNPYFVVCLLFCQRWLPAMRLGTLLSATLPYAIAFYIAGMVITASWVALDLPVGPGAQVGYQLPKAPLPAPAG